MNIQTSADSTIDKNEIEKIIKNFIINNPELIKDVLTNLSEKENLQEKLAGMKLLKDDKNDPFFGNPNGKKIIYEFSDYNCGYCKKIFFDLLSISNEDKDVKVVVKEFPILAESSIISAKAGIAAHLQKRFNVFHENLMTHRGRLDSEIISKIAENSGIDLSLLLLDMEDKKIDQIIMKNRKTAKILGIRGTPAIIIGDKIIPGAISKSEIKSLIKNTFE